MTPTEEWFKNRGSDFCYNSRHLETDKWVIYIKFDCIRQNDVEIINSVLKFRSIKHNDECYECPCIFTVARTCVQHFANKKWTEIIFNHLKECQTVQSYFALQTCKNQTRDTIIQLPIVLCDIIAEYGYENDLKEVFNLFPKNIFISHSEL